jgi:DNA-binding CsgD family transcriptional regulator/tetratricopeptide (TPR) repeat protein
MISKHYSIKFFIFFCLLLFSCNNEQIENQILTFDESKADIEINLYENENNFIENFIEKTKNKYKNEETFELWAINAFNKKLKYLNNLDSKLLMELNYTILKKQYTNLGYTIGNKTLEFSKIHSNNELIPSASTNIANYFIFKRNKDSLSKYLKILEENFIFDSNQFITLNYYNAKSNLADMNGQYFEEAVYIHKAIENTDVNDYKNRGTFYLNLASMYINLNYIEKANTCVDSALKLLSIDHIEKPLLNTIGIIQSKNKQFDRADKTFEYLINEGIKSNNVGLLAQTYSNLANSKRREKNYSEALILMQKSDSICQILNLEYGLIINKINRSELFLEQNKLEKALREILDAEKFIIEKYNNPKLTMEYYSILYKIYDGLNDKTNANIHYRNYNELKQLFQGDLPRSVISEWELTTEREKYLKNIAEHEIIRKNYLKIASISLLILFIASTIYFLKNKNYIIEKNEAELERQKIQYDLELKSKELLTESINNFTIQNTKNWIFDELDELVRDLPQSHQKKFINLKRKLKSNSNDQFMNEFEARFIGVYEAFYQKIQTIAPDLTPNELRICAFMRLHISTKEIAYLTNRTIGTIDNTRSIIRKKLKLEENDSLQQFLINL